MMHSLLEAASEAAPVAGNAHGSYVTMRSKNGLIFGVINVIGNFATVFQDQAVSFDITEPYALTKTTMYRVVLATCDCKSSCQLCQGLPSWWVSMVCCLFYCNRQMFV